MYIDIRIEGRQNNFAKKFMEHNRFIFYVFTFMNRNLVETNGDKEREQSSIQIVQIVFLNRLRLLAISERTKFIGLRL